MKNMKYSEIIKKNKDLEGVSSASKYNVAILSNIMVHQSKDISEYSLRTEFINANISLGDYDNILQDSIKFTKMNAVIIFWEIYNLVDGLEYKIELLSDKDFDDLVGKVISEINMVFDNLKDIPLVLVNKFSTLIFEQNSINATRLNKLATILNDTLNTKVANNIKIIDIDTIISKISISKAIDLRHYYSSKTLYSIDFYKEYFEYVKPIFLSVNGKSKKALIFDCDNTLWKGILGEDGFNNIKMFKEIQYLAVVLAKKGVIIGLCSKNNPEDVNQVLEAHQDMILKNEDIVIKKVNWNDKVSNLKAIAKELNIGLDSLVFIDDSNFEVNLIREKLPMVEVFQVPSKEYDYSLMVREISNLFYNITQTKEDLKKVQMYKAQIQRVNAEQQIGNIEDYLKSLDINVTIYLDDISHVARISQMTQKTNQFNVTTKRYTEKDIESFINSNNSMVISIGVNDKFGDNGIVGLAIVNLSDELATIDTLLMSCRVLGRNIEYKLMDIIVDYVRQKGMNKIASQYFPTYKNKQVADLFYKYGFDIIDKQEAEHKYHLELAKYKSKNLDYIRTSNGK